LTETLANEFYAAAIVERLMHQADVESLEAKSAASCMERGYPVDVVGAVFDRALQAAEKQLETGYGKNIVNVFLLCGEKTTSRLTCTVTFRRTNG
jgi:hypothetical protein